MDDDRRESKFEDSPEPNPEGYGIEGEFVPEATFEAVPAANEAEAPDTAESPAPAAEEPPALAAEETPEPAAGESTEEPVQPAAEGHPAPATEEPPAPTTGESPAPTTEEISPQVAETSDPAAETPSPTGEAPTPIEEPLVSAVETVELEGEEAAPSADEATELPDEEAVASAAIESPVIEIVVPGEPDAADLFNSAPEPDNYPIDFDEDEEEEGDDEVLGESVGREFDEDDIYDFKKYLLEEQLSVESGEHGAGLLEEEDEMEKMARIKFEQEQEAKQKADLKKRKMSRRLSMFARKKSIAYREQERFNATRRRVSGDFQALGSDYDILGGHRLSIASYQISDEFTSEEEEEEELIPIDREAYYDIYREIYPKRNYHKMKNNLLQRKMADFFKKRKMDHVLKETDNLVDSLAKYHKKLEALEDLINANIRTRNNINSELSDLKSSRDDQLEMLAMKFEKMQSREQEVGNGLINTKTGKEIPEKVVERFLKRQLFKSNEVATLRLVYIKLRNRVAEKRKILHNLDIIGPNLHLIDYEQLKNEKQCHTDKIEERDDELSNLRTKCRVAIQCLAHIREKSAAVTVDMISYKERLEDIEKELHDARENVNYLKHLRDGYRFQAKKLQDDAGVLAKPKLCVDMQISMEKEEQLTQELHDLKLENQEIKRSLAAIKKNVFDLTVAKNKEAKKIKIVEPPKSKRIYKGRPTLQIPQLPESDWSLSTS